jgi:rhodanese-related sulfurtransferase
VTLEVAGSSAGGPGAGSSACGPGGGTIAPVPPGARTIASVLEKARAGLSRLTPGEAHLAVSAGALLVDTRTPWQREAQGELPGAVVIDRTVLEWRLDPTSDARIPEAVDYDRLVIVVCRQGYSSSLAAAGLQSLGLWRATDVIGGVEAWLADGLPTFAGPADLRP